MKSILNELEVPHHVRHCFTANLELDPRLALGGVILIRDPKSFFVSLMRWSDKRCTQGLAEGREFSLYRNRLSFGPWLERTEIKKLEMIISMSPDLQYLPKFVTKYFDFITTNISNAIYSP